MKFLAQVGLVSGEKTRVGKGNESEVSGNGNGERLGLLECFFCQMLDGVCAQSELYFFVVVHKLV